MNASIALVLGLGDSGLAMARWLSRDGTPVRERMGQWFLNKHRESSPDGLQGKLCMRAWRGTDR